MSLGASLGLGVRFLRVFFRFLLGFLKASRGVDLGTP